MQQNILIILIILFVKASIFGQTSEIVLKESFENNDNGWRLYNTPTDKSSINNGKLNWSHSGDMGNSISNYINLLNTTSDFSVEAQFDLKKIGSEFGIMFGGIDQENALYFLIKNLQYRIFEIQQGKPKLIKDYTTSLKIKPEKNKVKVLKKSGKLQFLVNDHSLTEIPYSNVLGKAFGVALWNNSAVEVEEFLIQGKKLKINIANNLFYATPSENMGPGINTSYGELTPVIAPDGKGIYFTRTYSPENKGGASDYQDIYFSSYENGKWNKAINIGIPVNNDGPNAVCSVTPDGNTLLLMNTYDNKGSAQGMGLSISHKIKEGWSVPQPLKIRNYYNKSTFNEYFLSNDGKVLLLALQRDDTYGTRDIYVSFLESGDVWSAPKNLGPMINTPGTELSPFLASDGVSLYFSSTGHPGFGKNDIFVSRRLDESWTKWTTPQNVGTPINTKGIDAYYTIPASGEFAYFVSEEKSIGGSDIFRIKLPQAVKPQPVLLIYGKVLNSKTGEPIATGITYHDFQNDVELGIARSNPDDGSYKITLPIDKAYTFFAEKEGFYSVRDSINVGVITGYKEIERNIYLTPLEVGQNIPLNNIFFVRSEATLLPVSFPELNKLVKMLVENPSIEIELAGHTDNVGSAEKNLILSEQRVEKVKSYLVEKGVEASRITGKGYGGSMPIADNSVEATRKLNRRVEFKIVKF